MANVIQVSNNRVAYSIEETAQMLGVSKPTIYRSMKAGQIPYFYIGDMRRIPKAAIDKLLMGKSITTTH